MLEVETVFKFMGNLTTSIFRCCFGSDSELSLFSLLPPQNTGLNREVLLKNVGEIKKVSKLK